MGRWVVLPSANRPRFTTFSYMIAFLKRLLLLLLTVWHRAVHFPKVRLILALGKNAGFGSDRPADFARLFTLVHGSVVPEPVYA